MEQRIVVAKKNAVENKVYVKQHSFNDFISNLGTDIPFQKARLIKALGSSKEGDSARKDIIAHVLSDLKAPEGSQADFYLTTSIADEVSRISDENLVRYAVNRYRYDVFPKKRMLDLYPPYLQIEPSSICNFKCVFCYQTNKEFTDKNSGHMGTMSLEMYRDIIDQIEGKVDFISLASRGEPFVCRDLPKMLEYCRDKFLGLKVNTNASLLNEERCHALLSGGVNTIVFSADAAEEPLYSQLRVGGKLDKVLANVKLLLDIKKKHYPNSQVITRVSGVMYSQSQNIESMVKYWGELVDQVCFVRYNPWENVYESPANGLKTACSDLWRRMFVWYDGKVNPCDTDYKSTLSVGNLGSMTVSQLWRSEGYQKMREAHLSGSRKDVSPCKGCSVV